MQNCVQFIAQPVVQRHIRTQFERVLREQPIAAVAEVAMRVANELQRPVGNSLCKVDQGIRNVHRISVAVSSGGIIQSAEGDLPTKREIIQAVELLVTNIATDLERVSCGGVRKTVDPLKGVRCGAIGLIDSAAQIGYRCTSAHKTYRK